LDASVVLVQAPGLIGIVSLALWSYDAKILWDATSPTPKEEFKHAGIKDEPENKVDHTVCPVVGFRVFVALRDGMDPTISEYDNRFHEGRFATAYNSAADRYDLCWQYFLYAIPDRRHHSHHRYGLFLLEDLQK
jgi:hypothetical protein